MLVLDIGTLAREAPVDRMVEAKSEYNNKIIIIAYLPVLVLLAG